MSNQETITIYVPSDSQIKSQAKILEFHNSKSDLLDELTSIQNIYKAAWQINYCDARGRVTAEPPKTLANLFAKSLTPFKKHELALMLAAVTADKRNMLGQVKLWSPERKLLMYSAADNGICTRAEMDAVLKRKQNDRDSYYYYGHDRVYARYVDPSPLVTWIEYAKINSRGGFLDCTSAIYGTLTHQWQLAIFGLLHEDVQKPFPNVGDVDIIGKDFIRVNLQNRIGNALTYMVQAYRADVIDCGGARILSKSHLKRIKAAQLDMNPFADGPYHKLLDGYFAQSLAAHFLRAVSPKLVPYKSRTMPDGMKIAAQMLKNTDILDNIQLFELILPHLSGFKVSALNKFQYEPYVSEIKCLLKTFGQNWLDVQVLKHKVYSRAIEVDKPRIMSFGIESAELLSAMTDKLVTAPTQNANVMYPFIEGFLVQLMAMGVVEGVFAPLDEDMNSYFEGLRYVRLTELGQTLFGFGNDYTLSLTDKYAGQYDLVDGPLLVYSRLDDNPNDHLLAEVAVKTGRYWQVTTESFMRYHNSIDNIQQTIDQFKQAICKNPPKAWQEFFDSILAKAKSGPTKDSIEWYVMDIDPKNTVLQRLLCTEEFRNIVVRAEGYRILVKKTAYDKFRMLMKENGYLI